MDLGQYGKAEDSYRKALSFDPTFLVGKSVLARLTTDLNERLYLYDELEVGKDDISGDERMILDVYIALTRYTNSRDQQIVEAEDHLQQALDIGFHNLGYIAHKYPEEIYLNAEYIEIIHSIQGAQASLDSLNKLLLPSQKKNPFLLGYSASIHAEIGNFEQALHLADQLNNEIHDPSLPKSHAVYADIYYRMDSLSLAKNYADRAVELDPRNLDASRLKSRIDARLSN
jgi:tetratricopeptide (TPR) repeat protein